MSSRTRRLYLVTGLLTALVALLLAALGQPVLALLLLAAGCGLSFGLLATAIRCADLISIRLREAWWAWVSRKALDLPEGAGSLKEGRRMAARPSPGEGDPRDVYRPDSTR